MIWVVQTGENWYFSFSWGRIFYTGTAFSQFFPTGLFDWWRLPSPLSRMLLLTTHSDFPKLDQNSFRLNQYHFTTFPRLCLHKYGSWAFITLFKKLCNPFSYMFKTSQDCLRLLNRVSLILRLFLVFNFCMLMDAKKKKEIPPLKFHLG